MIAIDDNGNFVMSGGKLTQTSTPEQQAYKAECRCMQGTYAFDTLFGLNPLVWQLSQSINDRISDLYRIGYKYLIVNSIVYSNGSYIIQ